MTKTLSNSGIDTARLDVIVLLEDVTHRDRSWLLAHGDTLLTKTQREKISEAVQRRSTQVPLAYIRGRSEFYGRAFAITESVLVPRPETEEILDMLLDVVHALPDHELDKLQIIDVGTGSGALAISAKLEVPSARVHAVDIDKNCLDLAKKNAATLHAEITFHCSNLLASFGSTYAKPLPSQTVRTILLANLPYVPTDYPLNTSATHEPRLAIFGGHDGLDLYRELFAQCVSSTRSPDIVFTESLPFQHEELASIAYSAGYTLARQGMLIQQFAR